MKPRKTTIIGDLISFLFPTYCIECAVRLEEGRKYLCADCATHLPRYAGVEHYYRVWERFEGLLPFTRYEADLLFTPDSTTRALIHLIKYHGHPELGRTLSRLFAQSHYEAGHFVDCSLIIPIPLTPTRLRKRGYNQAEFIAKGFAEVYQVPVVTDLLQRRDSRGSQTYRGRQSRWKLMEDVFYTTGEIDVTGRRVLLIDDVLTTGSTLIHAGRALHDAGIESLSLYTLAADIPHIAL